MPLFHALNPGHDVVFAGAEDVACLSVNPRVEHVKGFGDKGDIPFCLVTGLEDAHDALEAFFDVERCPCVVEGFVEGKCVFGDVELVNRFPTFEDVLVVADIAVVGDGYHGVLVVVVIPKFDAARPVIWYEEVGEVVIRVVFFE